jgi:FkbM family methyltransferase
MLVQRLPWRIRQRVRAALEPRSWSLSQAGQDAWVFGEVFNEMQGGYFLDIGAHDGVSISNTYLLERRYRWSGLCIEANPVTFAQLKRNRGCQCLNVCLDRQRGAVEFAVRDVLGGIVDQNLDNSAPADGSQIIRMNTVPLVEVLQECRAPSVIDYLSIDVEGAEERVLDTFDFDRYRFNCITIERPSEKLRSLFHATGYVLIREIPGLDCFYVHGAFMPTFKANLFAFHGKHHLAMRWW